MTEPILHKQEVYDIVNCAMEVLNEVGHGLHENPTKTHWSWSSG
jgi:hypothetical protein